MLQIFRILELRIHFSIPVKIGEAIWQPKCYAVWEITLILPATFRD